MKKNKLDAQISYQRIIKTAITHFTNYGYHETRLEDIAAHIDMTRGAIYWHFKSKIALYEACVSHAFILIEENIKKTMNKKKAFHNQLTDILLILFEKFEIPMLLIQQAAQQNHRDSLFTNLYKIMNRTFEQLFVYLMSILNDAEKNGEVASKNTTEDNALLLIIFIRGLIGAQDFLTTDIINKRGKAHLIRAAIKGFNF